MTASPTTGVKSLIYKGIFAALALLIWGFMASPAGAVPAVPSNIQVSNISYDYTGKRLNLTVTWDAAENAARYLVYHNGPGMESFTAGSSTNLTLSYSATRVLCDLRASFFVEVLAEDATGFRSARGRSADYQIPNIPAPSDPTPPSVPIATATADANSITVSWPASTDAESAVAGYYWEMHATNLASYPWNPQTETSFTDRDLSGLPLGTTRSYIVRSMNASYVCSNWSESVTATTHATAITAVSNIQIGDATFDGDRLSANIHFDGALSPDYGIQSYRFQLIVQKGCCERPENLGTVAAEPYPIDNRYHIGFWFYPFDFEFGGRYYMIIVATDKAGRVKTTYSDTYQIPAAANPAPPSVPDNIQAIPGPDNGGTPIDERQTTLTLSWNPAVDLVFGIKYYEIMVDDELKSVTGTTFNYILTGLAPGTTHTFSVRAVSAAGVPSPWSELISASTAQPRPAILQNFRVLN